MVQKQRFEAVLPTPEAADLTVRAAQAGVPLDEFLGVQVLAGAYGVTHPDVVRAELTWPMVGRAGTPGAALGCEEDGDHATKKN